MRIAFFVFFLLIFTTPAFPYEAICTYESGVVNSGTFQLSVNNGVLTMRFEPSPFFHSGTIFTYRFRNKTDSQFCYSRGNYYSGNMWDWGEVCVGKFNDGKFSISVSTHDGVAYGTCTLLKKKLGGRLDHPKSQ